MSALPCPFCGSFKISAGRGRATCDDCGACGPTADGSPDTVSANAVESIRLWNERREPYA